MAADSDSMEVSSENARIMLAIKESKAEVLQTMSSLLKPIMDQLLEKVSMEKVSQMAETALNTETALNLLAWQKLLLSSYGHINALVFLLIGSFSVK